jgi:arginine/serine-rich splicing factor 17
MTESRKVSETSSGEVVNGFRSCRDLSDIVPLYTVQGIYLKPIAKIYVSINLPQLKTPGNQYYLVVLLNLLIRSYFI